MELFYSSFISSLGEVRAGVKTKFLLRSRILASTLFRRGPGGRVRVFRSLWAVSNC